MRPWSDEPHRQCAGGGLGSAGRSLLPPPPAARQNVSQARKCLLPRHHPVLCRYTNAAAAPYDWVWWCSTAATQAIFLASRTTQRWQPGAPGARGRRRTPAAAAAA